MVSKDVKFFEEIFPSAKAENYLESYKVEPPFNLCDLEYDDIKDLHYDLSEGLAEKEVDDNLLHDNDIRDETDQEVGGSSENGNQPQRGKRIRTQPKRLEYFQVNLPPSVDKAQPTHG